MTRERRSRWTTREEAKAHFRTRRLFRHFTERCLEDYVQHGLAGRAGHYALRIDPEIEYRVYRTIPHGMGASLKAHARNRPRPLPPESPNLRLGEPMHYLLSPFRDRF